MELKNSLRTAVALDAKREGEGGGIEEEEQENQASEVGISKMIEETGNQLNIQRLEEHLNKKKALQFTTHLSKIYVPTS